MAKSFGTHELVDASVFMFELCSHFGQNNNQRVFGREAVGQVAPDGGPMDIFEAVGCV